MIKICENPKCRKEFEPVPKLQKRQRYCPACVQLTPYQRRLPEAIKPKKCANPACGVMFYPLPNLGDKQRYHTKRCKADHEHDQAVARGSANVKTDWVTAICPKCGVSHKVDIVWAEKFPPRLFCQSCNAFRMSERFSGRMTGYNQRCRV